MPLHVVGAGLGRTSTRSMKEALGILGLPTFHMTDMFQHESRLVHFERAEAGHEVDWDAMFEGYLASIDYPACRHWRQLAAAYPDAKVLLTVRPAAEWYRSVRRTIYEVSRRRDGAGESPLARYIDGAIWGGDFGGRFEEPEHAMAVYEAHNAAVIAEVPPERLLVYEVGAGWEPLCAFLDMPVPDVPYPRLNTSEEFIARLDAR